MVGLVGITQCQLEYILNKGEKEAVRFSQLSGLLPKSYKCTICKKQAKLAFNRGRNKKGITWRCGMDACRGEVSVRVGTVFEKSKIPIADVIRLLFFWSMRRTVDDAATEIQVSHNTVTAWYTLLRIKILF